MRIVLRPAATPRFARPREAPRPGPVVALRAAPVRHRLTAPSVVRAPPRPARARRAVPSAPILLTPVLRVVTPAPEAPARYVLHAPAPLAEPVAPVPIATSVGIVSTAGTHVTMTPADLTQPGLVNVTSFRLALFAGVW